MKTDREVMQQALRACKSLPDGWIVSINLERGAGWCEIIDPTGKRRDELEAAGPEGNLAHELSQCIDAVLASQAKP